MLTGNRNSQARIKKELEIFTYPELYYLNAPGNGTELTYLEDPHIRLQKSTGIIAQNGGVDWESELRGMNRKLSLGDTQLYSDGNRKPSIASFKTVDGSLSEESRAILPAWTFREKNMERWEQPFQDPQLKSISPIVTDLMVRRRETEEYKRPNGGH
jgi:hypothetical protein